MIRIDLLHRRGRRWRRRGTGIFLLLTGLAAGVYWTDQRYPLGGVWNELLAGLAASSEQEGTPSIAAPVVEPGAEPEATEANPGAPAPALPVENPAPESPPRAANLSRAGALPAAESGRETATLAPHLRRSAACKRTLGLYRRIPAVIRTTALIGNAAGEYTIEGLVPAEKNMQLVLLLDTLRQLPSRVNLSFWREGRLRDSSFYKFTFQGRLPSPPGEELVVLSAAAAALLLRRVGLWARRSGLDSLTLGKPIRTPLASRLARQRHKLWATGSYAQISAFADSLSRVERQAALGELMVVPIYQRSNRWRRAHLYAALDVLVKLPAPEP